MAARQGRHGLRGNRLAGRSAARWPDGKPFTLFETKDLSVQVVRLGPDGALYAATLPSGKVYRLNPDAAAKQDEASATVVFDAARLDGQRHGGESRRSQADATNPRPRRTTSGI